MAAQTDPRAREPADRRLDESGASSGTDGPRTRVLVIAPRDPAPSGRLRIGQYTEILEKAGYSFDFAPVNNLRPTKREMMRIARAAPKVDIIFVQRIASPSLALILRAARRPVVYDLDDAIHFVRPTQTRAADRPSRLYDRALVRYREVVRGSRHYSRQKRAAANMVRLADTLVVGNEYLRRELATKHRDVIVLPTCVFMPNATKVHRTARPIRIGWIGVRSNLYELQMLEPVFRTLSARHGDEVILTVVSSEPYETSSIRTEFVEWSLQNEAEAVRRFDVGIMPLHDNAHARGKCSFKAIQCMSYGIPVTISPVGMNAELVVHGENGYLAASTADWVRCLDRLIDDLSLRKKLGQAGRATIRTSYSSDLAVSVLLRAFDQVTCS